MHSPQSRLAPMLQKLASQSTLAEDETEALLALPYSLAHLKRGEFIVREGARATHCCVLLSGFAHRSKVTGEGDRQILSVHLRGDLVDLQNSNIEIADHSVEALTDADVAFIARQDIIDIAARYPNVARALWKETVIDGSITREWLLNVGHRDARQRISHLLCELALRQEAAGICSEPQYEWPMIQEQIGDAMGLTSVHVNRTMQGLRAEGLLRTTGRKMTILNWLGLQSAGDFSPAYLHMA
jgi:CRP-like cAMP-binding protein